jgi:hypothetical protein
MMLQKLLFAAAAIGLFAGLVSPAQAEFDEIDERFIEADLDGDYLLDKPEYLMIVLRQFSFLDIDRDNVLEAPEMGEVADDPEFTDNDNDGSPGLSIEEVIAEKLADFDKADANGDGALNIDEVRNAYEAN